MAEEEAEIKWEEAAKYGWQSGDDPKELKICRIIKGSCGFSRLHAEIEVSVLSPLVAQRFFRLLVGWENGIYSIDLREGRSIRRVAEGYDAVFNILDFDELRVRVRDWSDGYSAAHDCTMER